MPSATVEVAPNASSVPAGAVTPALVGGASIHACLASASDTVYCQLPTISAALARALLKFPAPSLPAGAVLEWVQPVTRTRTYGWYGWICSAQLTGYNTTGAHQTPYQADKPGLSSVYDTGAWVDFGWLQTQRASDGVPWRSCDLSRFEVLVSTASQWGWFYPGGSYAAMARCRLRLGYRTPPTVSGMAPTGTVTATQPLVSWNVDDPQDSFRMIVVAAGTLDGAGVAAGAIGFNPVTVTGPAWDSGRVVTSTRSATPGSILTPGVTYWAYVKAWAAPVDGVVEMASTWTGVSFTISATAVDLPTITATYAPATLTVELVVGRGAHVGGQNVADWVQVQVLNSAGLWVDARAAADLRGAGPWVLYDGERRPGQVAQYRARGVFIRTSDNAVLASAWATASLTPPIPAQWWLRDPLERGRNRPILVLNPHSMVIAKPQSVAYGIGSRAATVVHGGVKGTTHQVEVDCQTQAEYDALMLLLRSGRTLNLVDTFGEAWPVQPGDSISVQLVKALRLPTETTPIRAYRRVKVTFTEVTTRTG